MTRNEFWNLLQALENAGLACVREYICEGTPEECAENPSGTMILLHPGLRLADLPESMTGGDELVTGETRPGMMATGAEEMVDAFGRPHYLDADDAANAAIWQYWFIADEDED